jgi:hypothetical protein
MRFHPNNWAITGICEAVTMPQYNKFFGCLPLKRNAARFYSRNFEVWEIVQKGGSKVGLIKSKDRLERDGIAASAERDF